MGVTLRDVFVITCQRELYAAENVHLHKLSECFLQKKSEFQTNHWVKRTCSDTGMDIFFSEGSVTWKSLIYNSGNLESCRTNSSCI